jgi:hypothetical protein
MRSLANRFSALFRRQPRPEARPEDLQEPAYEAPGVVDAGRARDLITGSSGKHTDGYSAYYWNNEG